MVGGGVGAVNCLKRKLMDDSQLETGGGLAWLDAPRFRGDAWYLPDESLLGFVEIPAGPFLMGTREEDIPALLDRLGGERERYEWETPQHEIVLPTYYIARYPVTVAQFRTFVEDSGYQPVIPDLFDVDNGDDAPVVHVSWYEAVRYCQWLTGRLRVWEGTPEPLATLLRKKGWVVTLPSEAEWEKAARGTDGRLYPWGNDPDQDRANYTETAIGTASAVGNSPDGASVYGVADMAGNVWEWTRTIWCTDGLNKDRDEPEFRYPYDPADGREYLEIGDNTRWMCHLFYLDEERDGQEILELENDPLWVLCGGSFQDEAWRVRCSSRSKCCTVCRGWDLGFRVVASPVRRVGIE
jgi:formylglycine-generating enzyme required for sulfatase activity